ncbi:MULTISPECIES: hypothetical protein [unclassified Tenacibaculum]|uniref:hypothetical protein n=1 Tax=unclassified Tenacibaculum TaxID=2635139 RepID=UPI001F1C94D0|nr:MULTISPECIES: hypothetical protein [unclassified Tenacibaculum]MCF2874075.1 hypothetical protein [Tenacibaculum sp. Cn5-1]MCF2934656.1 hypothetical protein [Tenacibaculum sp. Cn5-34]MCG7510866.1 hypothetical protein [Tenacibaculum sp. Cn5-46]
MLENISNLGKPLNQSEQKAINGGYILIECSISADASTDWCCHLPQGCPQPF